MIGIIKKDWYSEEHVKEIFTPNLTAWRSRYDLKDQLLLKDNSLVIRNMRKTDMVPIASSSDMEHEVEPKETYRPDIIAYNMYGDSRLAWVILAANGFSDIFDLKPGIRIVIPSAMSLYKTGGVMSK